MYLKLAALMSSMAMAATPGPAATPAPAAISPNLPAANGPSEVGATEVSVLTYNIHGLPWPFARGRAAALAAIGHELAALRKAGRQPDIVLIQEGFSDDVEALVKASGYRYWVEGPGRYDRDRMEAPADAKGYRVAHHRYHGEGLGKFLGGGLHMLSDAPLSDVKHASFRYCAGFDCLANKGVLMARVGLPGVPGGLDVVTTHMNSRTAAGTSQGRSTRAHNLQVEEMFAFLAKNQQPGLPLLVGGDFNVKGAPTRYAAVVGGHSFSVVSEYCDAPSAGCTGQPANAKVKPWLDSQDLQGFASGGAVTVRPVAVQTLFPANTKTSLSDHDAYLVRYRLTWDRRVAQGGGHNPVLAAGDSR